ncbi:MAG: hypothetical protein GXY81_01025 [Candidatus Cloacimonetes bacterium]|nr:hypothetical protein [Candidatus Cloacimonadota bacterium]
MKRILISLILLILAFGLAAHGGLFGLNFLDELAYADSLLGRQGFFAHETLGNGILYTTDLVPWVDFVMLYVDPDTGLVHGWSVEYNAGNPEKQDQSVIDWLHNAHGNAVYVDHEREVVGWIFDESHVAIYSYTAVGSLRVMYYDFGRPELFVLPQ